MSSMYKPRSKKVTINLSEEEVQAISDAAAKVNLPVALFIRLAALKEVDSTELAEVEQLTADYAQVEGKLVTRKDMDLIQHVIEKLASIENRLDILEKK